MEVMGDMGDMGVFAILILSSIYRRHKIRKGVPFGTPFVTPTGLKPVTF